MSKGYASEDAAERRQRARAGGRAEGEEERDAALALEAAARRAGTPAAPGAAGPVVLVDRSEVRPGQLEALRGALGELAAFVEAQEPRVVVYAAYLNPDGTALTVVQVHPDAASLEHHLRVAAGRFPRFGDLVRMRAVELHGPSTPAVLALLEAKARLLGAPGVQVQRLHAGFVRPASP